MPSLEEVKSNLEDAIRAYVQHEDMGGVSGVLTEWFIVACEQGCNDNGETSYYSMITRTGAPPHVQAGLLRVATVRIGDGLSALWNPR